MGIFLFISFLFADLITCGACKMAIRQIFIYQNGILMGVHITKEQTEHPRVKALCEKSRRYWNIYQNSNLAAGSLVCLLAFFSMEWMTLVWIVWFLLYLAGMQVLMVLPLRRMYRLKEEQGWIHEKTRRTVYIDTELSAQAGRLAPKASAAVGIGTGSRRSAVCPWGGTKRMARGEGGMAGAGQRSHGRDSPDMGDASVSGGETQCGLQSEQPGQYSGEPIG